MGFTTSLKKNYEFRRLYQKGKSAAAPSLVVYFRKNHGKENRLGITVSNKIGNSVVRNRVRRRMREIYRLNEARIVRGIDLVVVARARSAAAGLCELEKDFLRASLRSACFRRRRQNEKSADRAG
jgi:ribonuclease P protein component